MKQFKILLSTVILLAALFVLIDQLFTPQPLHIVLETGQQIETNTADYFALEEVLILIFSAFLIGASSLYLFYNADKADLLSSIKKDNPLQAYEQVLGFLGADEKKVFLEILKAKNGLLQNKIVLESGLSKVKVTRILSRLERKNLIVKERYGLTNRIKVK